MAIQTIDPDPVYPEDGAKPGDHGEKAQKATERYRKGTIKPVEDVAGRRAPAAAVRTAGGLRMRGMKRRLFGMWSDNSAAVAPTVALSLFALIGAGGIAFDYARWPASTPSCRMPPTRPRWPRRRSSTRQAGARSRAPPRRRRSLVANQTLMANDGNAAACRSTSDRRLLQRPRRRRRQRRRPTAPTDARCTDRRRRQVRRSSRMAARAPTMR